MTRLSGHFFDFRIVAIFLGDKVQNKARLQYSKAYYKGELARERSDWLTKRALEEVACLQEQKNSFYIDTIFLLQLRVFLLFLH
jgi:hypothetical protein